MLLEKFGITGAAAKTVLAARDEGGALPRNVQIALMSQEEIQRDLLTTSDRQEQIQRVIAGMIGRLVGLTVLLPDKIAHFLPGTDSKDTAAGNTAFDILKKGLFEDLEGLTEYGETVFGPLQEGYNKAMKLKSTNIWSSGAGAQADLDKKYEHLVEASNNANIWKSKGDSPYRTRVLNDQQEHLADYNQSVKYAESAYGAKKDTHYHFEIDGKEFFKVIVNEAAKHQDGQKIN
jgi:hypothetical protein